MRWIIRDDMNKRRNMFEGQIRGIMQLMEDEKNQLRSIEFAIDMIGREIAAKDLNIVLSSRDEPRLLLRDTKYTVGETFKNVRLDGFNILGQVDTAYKLLDAAIDEYKYGFVSEYNVTQAVIFEDLKLAFIKLGRHHAAVASVRGDQIVAKSVSVVGYDNWGEDMKKDPFVWAYSLCDRDTVGLQDPHFQFALLLELAKKRYAMLAPAQKEASYGKGSEFPYSEELFRLEDENRFLKQELALLTAVQVSQR